MYVNDIGTPADHWVSKVGIRAHGFRHVYSERRFRVSDLLISTFNIRQRTLNQRSRPGKDARSEARRMLMVLTEPCQ